MTKKKLENICKECGSVFKYRPDRFSDFCSMLCKKKNKIKGKRFGKYKIIDVIKDKNRYACVCQCDCGNIRNVRSNCLESGESKSCGCLQREILSKNSVIDLKGKRFGRLLVNGYTNKRDKKYNVIWECQCDCGEMCFISSKHLINKHTESCGCLQRELSILRGHERCGENHPNWKGGISCEPYCEQWNDKEYKESIKERDGYMCLNPECNKTIDKLCIHHIDYNKKNCHPFNLITVCISCNSKANKDRQWHKDWYKAVIRKRYIEKG